MKTPTDAEIEAIVAEAIAAEASYAQTEAQPPSSAIVWWRAQMRARQEASRLAEQPITIVHALSIAAGIGLLLSLVSYAGAGVKGSFAWATAAGQAVATSIPALDLTSRWVSLTLTAMVISAAIATIAAYVIYADE
jgi:hypothetical protein